MFTVEQSTLIKNNSWLSLCKNMLPFFHGDISVLQVKPLDCTVLSVVLFFNLKVFPRKITSFSSLQQRKNSFWIAVLFPGLRSLLHSSRSHHRGPQHQEKRAPNHLLRCDEAWLRYPRRPRLFEWNGSLPRLPNPSSWRMRSGWEVCVVHSSDSHLENARDQWDGGREEIQWRWVENLGESIDIFLCFRGKSVLACCRDGFQETWPRQDDAEYPLEGYSWEEDGKSLLFLRRGSFWRTGGRRERREGRRGRQVVSHWKLTFSIQMHGFRKIDITELREKYAILHVKTTIHSCEPSSKLDGSSETADALREAIQEEISLKDDTERKNSLFGGALTQMLFSHFMSRKRNAECSDTEAICANAIESCFATNKPAFDCRDGGMTLFIDKDLAEDEAILKIIGVNVSISKFEFSSVSKREYQKLNSLWKEFVLNEWVAFLWSSRSDRNWFW